MAETVKLEGLDDLKRAVSELKADLRRKVIRGALRDAAGPIARAARAKAPVLKQVHPHRLPGTLKRSIVVKSSKQFRGQGNELGIYIAVRKRKGLGGKAGARNPFDPFYWRFQEFGTAKMRARPFMNPAFSANAQQAIAIFQAKLKARIAKANARK